jgi:hypothetical protein
MTFSNELSEEEICQEGLGILARIIAREIISKPCPENRIFDPEKEET